MSDCRTLVPGDELPPLEVGPITRATLALFAGASGDHNPIHIDIDAARAAGRPDVFAQGMLSMAYLARVITDAIPQDRLRQFGARFVAITEIGDRIRCTARVEELLDDGPERLARLTLEARTLEGKVTLVGSALVAIGPVEG